MGQGSEERGADSINHSVPSMHTRRPVILTAAQRLDNLEHEVRPEVDLEVLLNRLVQPTDHVVDPSLPEGS